MSTWKPLKNADGKGGVRYREHSTRKHGAVPDRYYVIVYWWQDKTVSEAVGWASERITPTECFELLAEIKHNQSTGGSGPCTLAELRKLQEYKRQQADAKEKAEALTLSEYWPIYFSHAQGTKKSISASKEESHFRHWLAPTLGAVPLRQIELVHWDDLVTALAKAGRSKRTQEYVTGTLRRVMKHAYERRLVDSPPPTGKRIGVTGPGSSNRRLRVIRPEEAEALLAEIRRLDPHAWRLTRFAFLTGARVSECFNLRWCDVDFTRRVLVFVRTKNGDARQLPLAQDILDLLNEVPQGKPERPVFTKSDGTAYREAPSAFRTAVAHLGLNTGRDKRDILTFHSIRHSVATRLAQSLNLRDLMGVMGWRTFLMALRYVHGNEAAKAAALAELHGGMKPKNGGTEPKKGAKIVPFKRQGAR